MKINFKTLLTVYISFFICLNLIQCSSLGKIAPEYKGIDPRAEHFVKEFKEIAKMHGITFEHEVTVGFKNINSGTVIGLTSYGNGWREVDLSESFWNRSTELTRKSLTFHEFVHAFCNKGHVFGPKGTPYPEFETWKHGKEPKEGHYTDGSGCPLSIMYPTILDDFCLSVHYSEYMTEMLQGCKPY